MIKMARDLVQKLSLLCSLESAIIDKLEDLEKEQYKIREDYKRCTATNRNLESRYSELFYGFSSVKKDIPEQFNSRIREIESRLMALEGAQK